MPSLQCQCALLGTSQQWICPGTVTYNRRKENERRRRPGARLAYAVGWDPEGILRAPQGGHISRRTLAKEVEKNNELQQDVERLRKEKEKELETAREARRAPETHAQIVDYFLETEAGEMQFETARRRPLLTEDFFAFLSSQISEARFGSKPNEERSAELEGLSDFLKEAVKLIDSRARDLAAPSTRMRKLLTAPDKKATLLAMAGNNEIDKPLLDLLSQNIAAAQAAGQPQAAEFMQKIKDAAQKFVLVP